MQGESPQLTQISSRGGETLRDLAPLILNINRDLDMAFKSLHDVDPHQPLPATRSPAAFSRVNNHTAGSERHCVINHSHSAPEHELLELSDY